VLAVRRHIDVGDIVARVRRQQDVRQVRAQEGLAATEFTNAGPYTNFR
jgi:hypothetical protein